MWKKLHIFKLEPSLSHYTVCIKTCGKTLDGNSAAVLTSPLLLLLFLQSRTRGPHPKSESLLGSVVSEGLFCYFLYLLVFFLLDPEALYVLLRRGQTSGACLFCSLGLSRRVEFTCPTLLLIRMFKLKSITPPVLSTTGYRARMPNDSVLLHGGCCCLWYFVYDVCKHVCICALSYTPPLALVFFCPLALCPCLPVSEICIMLFDLPDELFMCC